MTCPPKNSYDHFIYSSYHQLITQSVPDTHLQIHIFFDHIYALLLPSEYQTLIPISISKILTKSLTRYSKHGKNMVLKI